MLKELEPVAASLLEERSRLNATLDLLSDEEAGRLKVNSDWSIKDALAHLAGAERGMLKLAERMARGENPQLSPEYDNNRYNARQVAKRQGMDLRGLRAELESSRSDLLAFIENLSADQLALHGEHPVEGDTTVKELLTVIGQHETSHGQDISYQCRELKK